MGNVLERLDNYLATALALLTPRLWKKGFGAALLEPAVDRVAYGAGP